MLCRLCPDRNATRCLLQHWWRPRWCRRDDCSPTAILEMEYVLDQPNLVQHVLHRHQLEPGLVGARYEVICLPGGKHVVNYLTIIRLTIWHRYMRLSYISSLHSFFQFHSSSSRNSVATSLPALLAYTSSIPLSSTNSICASKTSVLATWFSSSIM